MRNTLYIGGVVGVLLLLVGSGCATSVDEIAMQTEGLEENLGKLTEQIEDFAAEQEKKGVLKEEDKESDEGNQPTPALEGEVETFIHPQHGYAFDYPVDWKAIEYPATFGGFDGEVWSMSSGIQPVKESMVGGPAAYIAITNDAYSQDLAMDSFADKVFFEKTPFNTEKIQVRGGETPMWRYDFDFGDHAMSVTETYYVAQLDVRTFAVLYNFYEYGDGVWLAGPWQEKLETVALSFREVE